MKSFNRVNGTCANLADAAASQQRSTFQQVLGGPGGSRLARSASDGLVCAAATGSASFVYQAQVCASRWSAIGLAAASPFESSSGACRQAPSPGRNMVVQAPRSPAHIAPKDLELVQEVGRGATGTVYIGAAYSFHYF